MSATLSFMKQVIAVWQSGSVEKLAEKKNTRPMNNKAGRSCGVHLPSILVTEHIIGSGQVRNRVFVPGGSQQAPGICYGRIIPRVGLDWGIGPASTRNCVGVAIVGVDFTEPFMPEHFAALEPENRGERP